MLTKQLSRPRNHLLSKDSLYIPSENTCNASYWTATDYVAPQRIFSFGNPTLYALLGISLIAAVAAGVALAMVNVVMGKFIRLLGNAKSDGTSDGFMSAVSTTAYVLPQSRPGIPASVS